MSKRQTNLVDLSVLKEHEAGRVAFIRGDNKLLNRLLPLGLTLGARVEIARTTSLKSPLEISAGGSKIPGQEYCH